MICSNILFKYEKSGLFFKARLVSAAAIWWKKQNNEEEQRGNGGSERGDTLRKWWEISIYTAEPQHEPQRSKLCVWCASDVTMCSGGRWVHTGSFRLPRLPVCLLLRHTCTHSTVTSIYPDLQLTLSSRLQCHKSAAAYSSVVRRRLMSRSAVFLPLQLARLDQRASQEVSQLGGDLGSPWAQSVSVEGKVAQNHCN